MKLSSLGCAFHGNLKNLAVAFVRAKDGVAALEFAMIAPFMIAIFLGAVEFSGALTVNRRVTTAASATADLVAQSEAVTDSDLDQIMIIANQMVGSALIGNYNPALLEVKVTSIQADPDGVITVGWSYDNGGGEPYTPGSSFPNVPSGLLEPLSSVIVAEVKYTFDPPIGHYITGSIDLQDKFYLRPRRSLTVQKN